MSDDDYMSEDFIKAAESTSTQGLATSHTQKRALKMERMRYENEERLKKKPKRDELEQQRREEALNKPVCESSKGFALLAKMGYKPGMSLGKKKDENDKGSGIMEPIPLEVKTGKKGLGHDTNLKVYRRERTERIRAEMDVMKGNASRQGELLEEFRQRKKDNRTSRKLVVDIIKCRKACLDLDLRLGMSLPIEPWFWKSYPTDVDQGDGHKKETEDVEYAYGNGKKAPMEERFDEMNEEELRERLLSIVEHLRSVHLYCAWCGHVFSSSEEMSSNCDGPLPDDHGDD